MRESNESIRELLTRVKVDKFHVSCYFRCDVTNKTVVSTLPFEPYEGKIEFTWQEILLHPIQSYNRYYHTPITIYGNDFSETIVLKCFEKIRDKFVWDRELSRYIYKEWHV